MSFKVVVIDDERSEPPLKKGDVLWCHKADIKYDTLWYYVSKSESGEGTSRYFAKRFKRLTSEEIRATIGVKEKQNMPTSQVSRFKVIRNPVVRRWSESAMCWVDVTAERMPAEYLINCLRKDLQGLTASEAVDSELIQAYVQALYEHFNS